MDPEWQRQAHQAMEERAAGDFDAFKEREFEEFWGQKQKVDSKFLAGDASKVRLDEMLTAGLFKEGDVWSFSHTFGRREDAVSIQKECRVNPFLACSASTRLIFIRPDSGDRGQDHHPCDSSWAAEICSTS